MSTRPNATPQTQHARMRSTTHNIARKQGRANKVPEKLGTTLSYGTARKAHTTTLRPAIAEREQRARAAPDRHGTAEHVFTPNQSLQHRPVRVWTGSTDSGALSVPMQTVDSTASRDAAVHVDGQRKHVALPGRQAATDDANGRQTWTQCERRFDSQWRQEDLTRTDTS